MSMLFGNDEGFKRLSSDEEELQDEEDCS